MEYEPQLGMLGCDREVFAKVWARVAPNSGEGCPIQVLPPEPLSPAVPAVPVVPAVPIAPAVSSPSPAPRVDTLGEDDPGPGEVACLGAAAGDHGALLQSFIRHELEDWRTYQALARRGGGMASRTLSAMAADERRHARRLSAAYFLIAGIRFLPETPPARREGSFFGALRNRFWEEQHGAAAYLSAAEETDDLCLAALYRDLAGEELAHADLIRSLVEQL